MTKKQYTLKSSERLKSNKEISRIFKNGIFLYSDSLSVGYILSDTNKFAVSVPKRNFKSAVKRNLLKRRIRESYRLNKADLYAYSQSSGTFISFLFIYRNKELLPYSEINKQLTELLKKLTEQL
jgi:ribonuclease P protein component